MDHLDFSEEEIQQQLSALGYNNIPKQRLREFKRDLDHLIRHEKSKSHSSSEWSSPPDSRSGKSPPALVKEKVHLNNIGPSRNYALFNTSSVGQHHDIFTSTFHEEDSRDTNHYYDSYSRHSIAHRPARPSTAPNRLETEEGSSEIFYSVSDASHTTSPERENWAQKRPMVKRKVLRKYQGQSHVCDESTHSEDSGAVSVLEERMDHMQIGASRVPYDSESEEPENYSNRSSSATDEPSSDFIKGMTRSQSESDIRPRPKSFIRPVFEHPHTRNWKKSDPVAKYFQYKQEWEMFKPPGEKSRKELHWAIRERLLHQPPPPRPQKTYIPNNYVVPTEKKRSALRWEIRHDLAHGFVPKKPPTPDIEDVSLMPFTF
ncbi:centriolar and ciliogenesis-associated protein HYSL1 isoform X2 [Triplophysa dalaica]|uniref:centriolar and ciliogenesis-associated protein HYSL1 isoform X2 n=1 Tax=Triplophysa dalaica TaxID=1582913 RepID=UPI0024DF9287|nr:centriolar and ciliogenesis-associated protein HYSL1 isoform X2 [Triplophysa dalaica]